MKNYVDKDGLQDFATKMHNKQKTIFAPIEAVGSPLTASTVAEMTDTTKVYVYTGSESGYTEGNWYYYDGSAWTSGGIYNSAAVDTDTTLSVSGKAADALVVGEKITSINNLLYNGYSNLYTSSDFERGTFSTTNGQSANTTRIRLKTVVQCTKGTKIILPDNNLYYIIWYLSTTDLTTPSVLASTGWITPKTITVSYDCYVYMAIANGSSSSSSTTIQLSDFTDTITIVQSNYINNSIDDVQTEIQNINNDIDNRKELYLSDFIQAGVSASGFTTSVYRIATKDCVALPYGDRTKLTIHINDGYVVGIRAGRISQNLSSNLYWYYNGDTVTFSNHEQYYRVIIANPISVTDSTYNEIDVNDLSDTGIKIYYELDTGNYKCDNTINRNIDNLETLVNAQNVLSNSSHGGITTYPIILHISDLHGDRERLKNAFEIAEYINADVTVISGDIVSNVPEHGAQWMHELINDYNGLPIICTGNHDVMSDNYTDSDVYDYLMQPSASKIGNTNNTTYYYTDISSKKLRIIVCDLYQYGATTRSNTHMSDAQLSYICDALLSTPNNYGILLVSHTPSVDVSNLIDADYSTFFQSLRKYGFTHYDINGAPLNDIIDAFIGREAISQTYTQTGSPSSITVNADFSEVDNSIEFIAHLTGHIHEDSVCYLNTTEKQLMLNISCANAMNGGSNYPYLADDSDITKIPYGKTQDIMNAYVIDRTNKKVKIVRIGGTKTYDMKTRDYMEIPYAD